MKVEFPLNREFLVCIKNFKREGCLWPLERGRVPANAQQLTIVLDPFGCSGTSTKLYIDVVNSTNVHNEYNLRLRVRRWARSVLMTKMKAVVEILEGRGLKKCSIPDLSEDEVSVSFRNHEHTSRRCNGRFSCW